MTRIIKPTRSIFPGASTPRGLSASRRTFLKAAGLLGASSFLPSLAHAQGTPPKRLVVLFSSGGADPRQIRMRPPNAPGAWDAYDLYDWEQNQLVPDDLEFEFDLGPLAEADFSPTLAPLYRHRHKMLVTEGLALTATRNIDGDAHAQAHLNVLTGAYAAYEYDGVKAHASAPSIDQLVSDHIRATENPVHQSLSFGLPIYGGRHAIDPFHSAFYRWSDSQQLTVDRVPFEADPVAAWDRLFRGVISDGNGPSPRELAQTDVFNAVSQHYASLLPRLSAGDRQRLDQHRTLLLELQQSLAQLPQEGCQPAAEPGPLGATSEEMFLQDLEAWFDLTVAAFSCDLTRVVSIRDLQWAPNSLSGIANAVDWHHDIDHNSGPEQHYNPNPEYTTAVDAIGQQDRNQASWIASLCDRLDGVLDPDGGTMLDNTLVLWVKEMSHGNHGHEAYHTIALGNLAGHFNTGRYVKYAQNNPNPWHRNYRNEYTGTPYNRYLVSLIQAYGMTQNQMGTVAQVEGSVPHANITGTIDHTGPLPRLT